MWVTLSNVRYSQSSSKGTYRNLTEKTTEKITNKNDDNEKIQEIIHIVPQTHCTPYTSS